MHLEVLAEGPSDEAALASLLPRLLGEGWEYSIRVFDGKLDLLGKLPSRLRARRRCPDWHVLVLIDEDCEDCLALKDRLERKAEDAGWTTKTGVGQGPFDVLNRIAVEELEAWFFGDVQALRAVYPSVPSSLACQPRYSDPDAIPGGTWEALERVLRKAGYYAAGMPKIEVAREVSKHMDPDRNRSRSFQVFRDGVRALGAWGGS